MQSGQAFMQRRLQAMRHRHLFRQLSPLEQGTAPWMTLGTQRFLNLSSNNYLGLAEHPSLKEAAIAAIQQYGCGAGASRLVTGTTPLHALLEERLARFKGSEQALLFSSGYQANSGVLTALAGKHDVILGDAYNHASLIDGSRLSGATYIPYVHGDVDALHGHLQSLNRVGHRGLKLVVTDSVFSMDGDVAPLDDIATLCETYDALLIVDEAHATGCLGPGGRGLAAHLLSDMQQLIIVDTLSKAFGVVGAFVSASKIVKDFLVNVARSFIFTTALPPAEIAACLAALDIVEAHPELSEQLQERATFFRDSLRQAGFQIAKSETHIIPLLIGDVQKTLQMAQILRERGIYAVAIRPPSVPVGAARIRFSLMLTHSWEDLTFALTEIERAGRELGLIAEKGVYHAL